ncbi:hypothetical protein M3Y97_00551200 [Aphelenchoides bicaudatus]|nr:hypothetical protein M3Y97_00551200 [Aphelenchoides bicaudatus]
MGRFGHHRAPKPLFNDSISEFRAVLQRSMLLKLSRKGNHVEYTEPTILVTHNHLQQAIESHGPTSSAPANIVQPTSLQRCESSNSVADKEICATLLRNRSRTESEMADDDDLLDEEAGKLRNNDRLVDDFDHMHLNGSLGPRRRILPQTINKEQVLSYIANTNNIFIRRSGTELQVTDSTGFPLIDVWQKNRCFQSSSWVLESYGRTVLLLHSIGRPWKPWAMRKTMPVLEVESSDDELLGYFVTADPFIIQNRDRQVVARFNSFDSGDGRTILYQCLLECSGEEICRLEPRKSQLSQLRFGQGCSTFPLKLLVLAAAVRIAAMQALNTQPNHSVSPGTRRPTKRRNKSSCCSIV